MAENRKRRPGKYYLGKSQDNSFRTASFSFTDAFQYSFLFKKFLCDVCFLSAKTLQNRFLIVLFHKRRRMVTVPMPERSLPLYRPHCNSLSKIILEQKEYGYNGHCCQSSASHNHTVVGGKLLLKSRHAKRNGEPGSAV